MSGPTKTLDQRIALLQGQIIALTVYVQAIAGQLSTDQMRSASANAESTLKQMADALFAYPFPDDVFDGIDLVRSQYFQPPESKT